MNKRDKRFITIWADKIENGVLHYSIKTTLLTCIISAAVVLFYTSNNIPENQHLESILPLSALTFGRGIALGLFLSWLIDSAAVAGLFYNS